MRNRAFFLLSLLTGLASCDRQPSAPSGTPIAPDMNWMNNPDNGNPRITRFEDHFLACWSDADNGLRACHATLPLGGATPDADCGPQEVLDPIAYQDVGLLNEDEDVFSWIRGHVKGRLWITVRDLTQPGNCFDNKLVAEGWGEFHTNDNSIFGVGEGFNFTNAWGLRGHGRLSTPEGETVVYNGHIHFIFGNVQDFREFPPTVSVH